jgi:hypothetical protein
MAPEWIEQRVKEMKAAAQEIRLREEWEAWQQLAIFGIGPPIALLILGFGSMWIFAGFRQSTK